MAFKKCPYCAEDIQEAAIKCRFCGEMLAPLSVRLDPAATWPQPSAAPSTEGMVREGGHLQGGRYRLDALLGRGGMAEVYRAFDRRLERVVALKVVACQADISFVRALEREARLAMELRHDRIRGVYHFEEDPSLGVAFLVTEFVDGLGVDRLIDARPGRRLTEAEAVHIGLQVLEGLAYAHARPGRGVIHRDLKPANLLATGIHGLDPAQPLPLEALHIKVSDFGLGIARREGGGAFAGGGTPAYMSPEQIEGHDPAPAMDIYSLGASLYEMLEGRPPYTGADRLHVPPPLKEVSRALRQFVEDCLERDPGARPGSALLARDRLLRCHAATETEQADRLLAHAEEATAGGALEEGVDLYLQVVQRFESRDDAGLQRRRALALLGAGLALGEGDRLPEAAEVLDELEGRFGPSSDADPALAECLARGRAARRELTGEPAAARARALLEGALQSEHPDQALLSCDAVVRRYGRLTEVEILRVVAAAHLARCCILSRHCTAQAAPYLDRGAVAAVGDAAATWRMAQAALRDYQALLGGPLSGDAAGDGGAERELAVAECALAVRQGGREPHPEQQERVAVALYRQAQELRALDRPQQALAALDELLRRFRSEYTFQSGVQDKVAWALLEKAALLDQQDRQEEAAECLDEVVARWMVERPRPASSLITRAAVARALRLQGDRALARGDETKAKKAYSEVVRRYAREADAGTQQDVACARRSIDRRSAETPSATSGRPSSAWGRLALRIGQRFRGE